MEYWIVPYINIVSTAGEKWVYNLHWVFLILKYKSKVEYCVYIKLLSAKIIIHVIC